MAVSGFKTRLVEEGLLSVRLIDNEVEKANT